ncbi:hypothetical protein ACWDG1_50130, partial [Streptomyces sp. NPDC001177]
MASAMLIGMIRNDTRGGTPVEPKTVHALSHAFRQPDPKWADLPEQYGSPKTVKQRFVAWAREGRFARWLKEMEKTERGSLGEDQRVLFDSDLVWLKNAAVKERDLVLVRVPDELWGVVGPYLARAGGSEGQLRTALSVLMWKYRSGKSWEKPPKGYGDWAVLQPRVQAVRDALTRPGTLGAVLAAVRALPAEVREKIGDVGWLTAAQRDTGPVPAAADLPSVASATLKGLVEKIRRPGKTSSKVPPKSFHGIAWMYQQDEADREWRRLPNEYGKSQDVRKAWKKWVESGWFDQLLGAMLAIDPGDVAEDDRDRFETDLSWLREVVEERQGYALYRMPDALWELLRPHLPAAQGWAYRVILEGIAWRFQFQNARPWSEMPRLYGTPDQVRELFQQWAQERRFATMLSAVLGKAASRDIDWLQAAEAAEAGVGNDGVGDGGGAAEAAGVVSEALVSGGGVVSEAGPGGGMPLAPPPELGSGNDGEGGGVGGRRPRTSSSGAEPGRSEDVLGGVEVPSGWLVDPVASLPRMSARVRAAALAYASAADLDR